MDFTVRLFAVPLITCSCCRVPICTVLVGLFMLTIIGKLLKLAILKIVIKVTFLPTKHILFTPYN